VLNYFIIKNIRKYLTQDATQILVLSLVILHLDITMLNCLEFQKVSYELQKFQRIQNMCAKLVLQRGKYDGYKDSLFELHWLPIKARINFKILCTMYNCFIGNVPVYLTELLHKPVLKRPNLRSAEDMDYCFALPIIKTKTFNDISVSTVGPTLWNKLPLYIKQSSSTEMVKTNDKTYFRDLYALF